MASKKPPMPVSASSGDPPLDFGAGGRVQQQQRRRGRVEQHDPLRLGVAIGAHPRHDPIAIRRERQRKHVPVQGDLDRTARGDRGAPAGSQVDCRGGSVRRYDRAWPGLRRAGRIGRWLLLLRRRPAGLWVGAPGVGLAIAAPGITPRRRVRPRHGSHDRVEHRPDGIRVIVPDLPALLRARRPVEGEVGAAGHIDHPQHGRIRRHAQQQPVVACGQGE